ncbi:MAG: BatD family protein [Croceitalea sp.]|nr:BatD family protein [Croceitalea sp.]
MSFTVLWGQSNSSVKATLDTLAIKIGEQIKYKISVETDSLNIVYFPEDQTFSPLEMVEALKIDTTKNKDRITLERIYALTQFDSGAYTIPPQRIAINEQPFFTDSFHINVANVAVDTTKQQMFDIKPMIKVEKSYAQTLWLILLIVGVLLAAGFLFYWLKLRKPPLTPEEEVALLPPFDRAIMQLKELEKSKYLIQDEYKKYYSELTDIVRSYLEEDVHVSALESTTDQLIDKLEMLKDAGELKLEENTIVQFKKVLQTADLVKFAKSKPPTSVAEEDRKVIESIVVKTKEALPEPTEEDLMLNEAYLHEMAQQKKRKRVYVAAASILGIMLLAGAVSTAYYGFESVKDTVLRHPSKQLLDGEWIQSSYGYPPIEIETPKVLLRLDTPLTDEAKAIIAAKQSFGYQNEEGIFSIETSSTTFTSMDEPDFVKPIEDLLKSFEKKGVKNIITKQEEFVTLTGVQGLKTYGTGKFKVPDSDKMIRGKYSILSFGGKGFQQQIVLTWADDDRYAEQIVQRILASVNVKTQA